MEKKEECSKRTQGIFESYDGQNIRDLDELKLNDLIDDSLKLNYGQFIDELINNVVYCNTKKFFEKKYILESIRTKEINPDKDNENDESYIDDINTKVFLTKVLERFFLFRNLPIFFLGQKEHIDKDLEEFENLYKEKICTQSEVKVYRIFSVMYSRVENLYTTKEDKDSFKLNQKILDKGEELSEEDRIISLSNQVSFSTFEDISKDILNILRGNIENEYIEDINSLEDNIENHQQALNEISNYVANLLFDYTKEFISEKSKISIEKTLNSHNQDKTHSSLSIKILINKFLENIDTIIGENSYNLSGRQINIIFMFITNYLIVNFGTQIKKSLTNPDNLKQEEHKEMNYIVKNLLESIKKLESYENGLRESKYIKYIVELLSDKNDNSENEQKSNDKNNFLNIRDVIEESKKDNEKEIKLENILDLIIKHNRDIEIGSIEHIIYNKIFEEYNSYCNYRIKTGLLLNTIKKVDIHFSPGHTNRVGNLSKSLFKLIEDNLGNYDLENYSFDYTTELKRMSKNLNEEDIHILSLLHDLGKIETDRIDLSKEGQLNEEEFQEVKSHARRSFKVFDNFFEDDKSIGEHTKRYLLQSFSHHEKLDGSGYPHGLEGNEIRLFSRIVQTSDALDAIVHRRGKNLEEIILDLEDNKGVQFDPLIVNILSNFIRKLQKEGKESLTKKYEKDIAKALFINEES